MKPQHLPKYGKRQFNKWHTKSTQTQYYAICTHNHKNILYRFQCRYLIFNTAANESFLCFCAEKNH